MAGRSINSITCFSLLSKFESSQSIYVLTRHDLFSGLAVIVPGMTMYSGLSTRFSSVGLICPWCKVN